MTSSEDPPHTTGRRRRTRVRGQGKTVALTVRVLPEEWRRAHQLALDRGVSLQGLLLRGLSREFQDAGLPPIEGID